LTGTWAYKVRQQDDALEPKTESKTGTDSEHENQNIIVVNKPLTQCDPELLYHLNICKKHRPTQRPTHSGKIK
jgi:hypothetical protein